MRAKLLRSLPMFGCDHQFSWPRRWQEGEYYQVCVRCGAEYVYDWKSMQRGARFERLAETEPQQGLRRASSWRPRARRVAVEIQVEFRERDLSGWNAGTICNVSESGVLIFANALLPPDSEIEMKFLMPKEISGKEGMPVIATGIVVRAMPEASGGRMAATIQVCRFLTQ
jgi:hypothetical protein